MPQTFSLQVESLRCRIGRNLLVDNVSFSVPPRNKVALVGLNGAGKSSLIRSLVGAMVPESGSIRYGHLHPRSLALNDSLGYQPADMQALPNFSCYEYLRLVCQTKSALSKNYHTVIQTVVEQWHLGEILNKTMSNLSQGNLQKIAIAQAFLGQPDFIFLDEPTQALDPIEQRRFIQNLQRLESFQLCLFSSHHISEAVQMADRVILLHHGRLICILDLKADDELWVLSRLSADAMAQYIPAKQIKMSTQRDGRYLYRINPIKNHEWAALATELGQQDTSLVTLGAADTALMALFNLLANEVL
jgi:ABC-type multidrug transport system ATPase subunit